MAGQGQYLTGLYCACRLVDTPFRYLYVNRAPRREPGGTIGGLV